MTILSREGGRGTASPPSLPSDCGRAELANTRKKKALDAQFMKGICVPNSLPREKSQGFSLKDDSPDAIQTSGRHRRQAAAQRRHAASHPMKFRKWAH